MRIAHVITGLGLGGAEMMLWKLLSAMDRQAFEPLVVSLIEPGPMGERIGALGVSVETLRMTRGLPSAGALVRLVRILREFRPDLIQTWMYHADLVGALARPWVGLGRSRPRLVWNIRQSDLDPRLTRRGTRLVARLDGLLSWLAPERIICCSWRAREVHRALGYRDGRMTVIPNGFDLERFRPDPVARAELRAELGISDASPLIGLVGRFDPQKDLPTFVAAARQVRSACPDCRFLLAGQGMDRDNRALGTWIQDAGLAEAIHLLGPRSDVPRVLAALDLLVSASAYGEGFPNVIGEAMASAVPCVVTDVGDSGLIIGDTGRLVPPRAPAALAQAIGALVGCSAETRRAMGAAARARVRAEYDLPVIVERYQALYLATVAQGARPRV